MTDAVKHPTLEQFRQAIEGRTVTAEKAAAFNKWRNTPAKCCGAFKEEADRLWAQYEAAGRSASAGVNAGASRPPARGGPGGQRADNSGAGDPSVLGEPFHNPYTFIPFPDQPPRRHKPTPLTIDEVEKDRFTGIVDLEVKLLSPLMTNSPEPLKEENGHKTFGALAVGNDVIVPATGLRGALRTLMTVLTGGTLGYVDDEAWLCQGRDARLGPAAPATIGEVPAHAFLAEVVIPGGVGRKGTVCLGRTKLVKADDLERVAQRGGIGLLPRPRPHQAPEYLWTDEILSSLAREKSARHPWKVKLSGRPIQSRGKREGLFLADEKVIELSDSLWSAYAGRHRHGDHPELKAGDLVWLEPVSFDITEIKGAADVKSIQWARWGREGERLLEVVQKHHGQQLPDAFNPDGLVDEVTDLFGQVPRPDLANAATGQPGPAASFAARIRPGNLVFAGVKSKIQQVDLAPLAPPHPGCAAFYRDAGDDPAQAADAVANKKMPLRGYKVFRTTSERGANAPWTFVAQGVYDEQGRPQSPRQKVNKTADLLPENGTSAGRMRLSVRALSRRELTLLLAACAVDWRLGGGKPLGLGHCRVASVALREFRDDGSLGDPIRMERPGDGVAGLPDPYAGELQADKQLIERMALWQASQAPLAKLRYPRAAVENRNRKSRGGHVWFQRHAQPRKALRDEDHPRGLQLLHLHPDGELAGKARSGALRAQPLPPFDSARPQADALHGYDLFAADDPAWSEQTRDRRTLHKKLEPFDPEKHGRSSGRSGGNLSQNRDNRQGWRQRR